MAERYSRLYSLPENQYTAGAPVLIAAGALLKDNQTGKALAQIKFKNITDKQIKAVKISIAAFDISGEELEGISAYQYLDLDAGRNEEFGQKQAVTLPDAVTRSYSVNCTDVFFADGSAWKGDPNASWGVLPVQITITEQLGDLATQYRRDTSPKSNYVPIEHQDLWFCSCGAINHSEESKCHNCRHNKAALFIALDVDILRQKDNEFNAAKAVEAEKQAAADKAQRAKTTKIAIIAAAVIALIVSAFFVATKIIIPNGKYNNAVALMNAGQYEEAIAAFEAMDGYEDSVDKIDECETAILDEKYNDAVALANAGKYEDAIAAFKALGDYKDSPEKISECETAILDAKYNDAYSLLESGKYGEALLAFRTCDGYSDSAEKIDWLMHKLGIRSTISGGLFHTVGLKSDGTVVAIGKNDDGQCRVNDWSDIVSVIAESDLTYGITANGNVRVTSTGYNRYSGYRSIVESWTNIVDISSDNNHLLGVKADGRVVAEGANKDIIEGWKDIIAVETGETHAVGLKADGTVLTAGANHYGQSNTENWTNIIAISAGGLHTVGLKADGTVVAVGYNKYNQCDVESWTDIIAVSAGCYHTVGLKADGTVVAIGSYSSDECDVGDWRNIVAISCGSFHTVGLRKNGSVVVAGETSKYRRELENWTNIKVPN